MQSKFINENQNTKKKIEIKFVVNNAHLTGKMSGKENGKKENENKNHNKNGREFKTEPRVRVQAVDHNTKWPKHAHSVMPYKPFVSDFINGIKLYCTHVVSPRPLLLIDSL